MSATTSRMQAGTWARRPSRRFLTFFAGSLGGLVVDVGGFALLTALGVLPALANVISSGCSISIVYLLVTRFTFGTAARPITYVAFFGWYAANIAVTSTAIALATHLLVPMPLLWKAVSVPLSFVANYGFSRLLFERLTGTATEGARR